MRLGRFLRFALVATLSVASAGNSALAHDEIESSEPAHQSQLDDPISTVTINFGEPVGNVELALVGPDDRDLPGTVTKVSDTEARLDFDELTREGEYIVRYLAEEDGHLVAGAITFVYGSRSGAGASTTAWVLFGLAALVILAIGAAATIRRGRRTTGDDTEPALVEG